MKVGADRSTKVSALWQEVVMLVWSWDSCSPLLFLRATYQLWRIRPPRGAGEVKLRLENGWPLLENLSNRNLMHITPEIKASLGSSKWPCVDYDYFCWFFFPPWIKNSGASAAVWVKQVSVDLLWKWSRIWGNASQIWNNCAALEGNPCRRFVVVCTKGYLSRRKSGCGNWIQS